MSLDPIFYINTPRKIKKDDGPETKRHNTFDLEAGKDLLGRTQKTLAKNEEEKK